MATTSIVGDVVAAVGGDAIGVRLLLPRNADPHAFEPAPQDLAAVSDADVVFINGLGLEGSLEPLVRAAASAPVVVVSEGVPVHDDEGHGEGDVDPHVWFDPLRVLVWVNNIEQALTVADPANAETYAENAEAYRHQLRDLDAWIQETVAEIPEDRRRLVTDHAVLGYFAERYGFEEVGAVIPGLSTLAEPSAQEIARLERAIVDQGVPAVFVGFTVSTTLADRLAQDSGVQVVYLYTGSLSEGGGPAGNYLDLMRYNVLAMVEALR